MFESERHFSHLSNLEREMTFRTEMVSVGGYNGLLEPPALRVYYTGCTVSIIYEICSIPTVDWLHDLIALRLPATRFVVSYPVASAFFIICIIYIYIYYTVLKLLKCK